jgi:hypothetical protein
LRQIQPLLMLPNNRVSQDWSGHREWSGVGRGGANQRSTFFLQVDRVKWMMSSPSQSEVMDYVGELQPNDTGDEAEISFTAENYAISYPFTFFESGWYMLIINQTMLKPSIVSPTFPPEIKLTNSHQTINARTPSFPRTSFSQPNPSQLVQHQQTI